MPVRTPRSALATPAGHHPAAGARLASVAVSGILAALLTAGCGDNDNGLPPPHPGTSSPETTTPALQLTAEEQEAVDEVRELFDEFMTAYIELATSGDPPDEEAMAPILQRIDGSLYNEINLELVDNYQAGLRMDGAIAAKMTGVVEVALDPEASEWSNPNVRLHYCVDATAWHLVDRQTGAPADDGSPLLPPTIQRSTVRAAYFDRGGPEDPRWYIAEWTADTTAGETC